MVHIAPMMWNFNETGVLNGTDVRIENPETITDHEGRVWDNQVDLKEDQSVTDCSKNWKI